VQFHAIMAGVAVAIALGSVGVACRRITGEVVEMPEDSAESLLKSLEPQPEPVHLRPGKAWLVAMLFFILTALGGWYVLGSSADSFKPKELWDMVADRTLNSGSPINRRLLHVIVATLTILLPLLLAAVGRWAPKQKIALIVLTTLLVLAIAAQVWLGVLLLFDTPVGPVVRFN
jgi:heme A synthase